MDSARACRRGPPATAACIQGSQWGRGRSATGRAKGPGAARLHVHRGATVCLTPRYRPNGRILCSGVAQREDEGVVARRNRHNASAGDSEWVGKSGTDACTGNVHQLTGGRRTVAGDVVLPDLCVALDAIETGISDVTKRETVAADGDSRRPGIHYLYGMTGKIEMQDAFEPAGGCDRKICGVL